MHAIYGAGGLDPGSGRKLIEIEDAASYARVMNNLGAEVAVDNQISSLLSSVRFGDDLLHCSERSGGNLSTRYG